MTCIQEALVCPFFFEEKFHVAVVLRYDHQCYLYTVLDGLLGGMATSKHGQAMIQKTLNVPVRLLDGQEGAFLARKVILAEHDGQPFYHL